MLPAPNVSPELAAAANCAGAFLLSLAFVFLAVAMVALHLTWRGLRVSRRSLPEAMALTLDYVQKLQTGAVSATGAFVAPQVALASRLAGLQAGLRTLVRGRPDPDRTHSALPGSDADGAGEAPDGTTR